MATLIPANRHNRTMMTLLILDDVSATIIPMNERANNIARDVLSKVHRDIP